jgi:hypothetical protein
MSKRPAANFKRTIVAVAAVMFFIIVNLIHFGIRELIWGRQMTWTKALIIGSFAVIISLIIAYFAWKKKGWK